MDRHEKSLDQVNESGGDCTRRSRTIMTRRDPLHRCGRSSALVTALLVLVLATPALAVDAGRIKISRGTAWVERAGARLPATVGTIVQQDDVIVTGADGAVGITLGDDSRLSIGPDTTLAIERFAFNPTTHEGSQELSLRRGTLAAVSGKLAHHSPEAMKVRTPAAILGVRGTEFVVRTGEVAR
jgi:hypothetical protein